MNLVERWNSKKNFETKTFTFLDNEVTIKELSGLEKQAIQNEDDEIRTHYLIYKYGVKTEELKMTETQFRHAFDKSHKEVDYILDKILEFSVFTTESKEELEKN